MAEQRGMIDIMNGIKVRNDGMIFILSKQNIFFFFFKDNNRMSEEPEKKRLKSENEVSSVIHLSTCDLEDEDNQLDKQIEQEESKADNMVIKDLMGSVKPEQNKVKFLFKSNNKLIFVLIEI